MYPVHSAQRVIRGSPSCMAWVQLQTMQEHANLARIRPALFTCSTVINNTVSNAGGRRNR